MRNRFCIFAGTGGNMGYKNMAGAVDDLTAEKQIRAVCEAGNAASQRATPDAQLISTLREHVHLLRFALRPVAECGAISQTIIAVAKAALAATETK